MMSCATRSTKGPYTSVMADPVDEASQDETSLHEESEPEQEVFTHNPQPGMHQSVYTNMYMPFIEGPKIGLDGKQCTLPQIPQMEA